MQRAKMTAIALLAIVIGGAGHIPPQSNHSEDQRSFIEVRAATKEQRSALSDLGMSIEFVRSDSVWGFADPATLQEIREAGHIVMGVHPIEFARGGHSRIFDFPDKDSKFHNYAELTSKLRLLAGQHADMVRVQSIGKSIENRDIWAVHINTNPDALTSGESGKPGVIFMGTHHAREHVSTEIPLMLIEYLLKNRHDQKVAHLLQDRDIWIIPMVNPDGVEHDISGGNYKMWRKNRRENGDGTYGVDLNRNYGYMWGTGGSSKNPSSDVYMGTAPFSEPETQAIRDFVSARKNAKVLLTFHTFSELILYPWGHKYDPVENERDRQVFEKLARTMASWNKYTPQASSDLYIASGDTVDWAYGELGIFAFTFELSPKSMWDGGFYPGQGVLDRVFADNLRPCLYLMEIANDPYQVLQTNSRRVSGFLEHYVQPSLPADVFTRTHPY